MQRRYQLLIFLSVIVLAGTAYNGGIFFFAAKLPMKLALVNGHTAEIHPLPGTPLPAQFKPGDKINLDAMDLPARAALAIYLTGWTLPKGHTYELAVRTESGLTHIPVTSIGHQQSIQWRSIEGAGVVNSLILGLMSLLLLWYGRNRAAHGMAIWSIGSVLGVALSAVPIDGLLGVSFLLASSVCFVLTRIGFYVTADSLVGASLSTRTRSFFRTAFIVVLALGSTQILIGIIALVVAGSAELLLPRYSILFSWVYLVPIAMLVLGSHLADAERRVRLRWVIWSAISFMAAATIRNAFPVGAVANPIVSYILFSLAVCGFMYSLLRHRVVDLSVFVDRALVYGGLTMLVVGILAAVNSLTLRATVGEGTGLLLQIIVPFSLGITLGKVHVYMDMLVERVFFRRKYLAEKALLKFARHCGHVKNVSHLLESTIKEVGRHIGSPSVAIYASTETGSVRVEQSTGAQYPEHLEVDDSAMVAVRAEHEALDLSANDSALGNDGCVFPMVVLGVLRGVLVCTNRPGEHYPSDEKKLLMQVAQDVGAAWRMLLASENEEFIRAVAHGQINLRAAKAQARTLEHSWAGTAQLGTAFGSYVDNR